MAHAFNKWFQPIRRYLCRIDPISTDISGASMLIRIKLGVILTIFAFAGVTLAQTPAVKPERIRGEIASLDGDTLKVQRHSGETVAIEVKPAVAISAVK